MIKLVQPNMLTLHKWHDTCIGVPIPKRSEGMVEILAAY